MQRGPTCAHDHRGMGLLTTDILPGGEKDMEAFFHIQLHSTRRNWKIYRHN